MDDIAVFPLQPSIAGIRISGRDLVLNGLNGIEGRSYSVLRSASATLPFNQWTSIGTYTLTSSGNFTFTVPNAVDPAAPQRYYILKLQ